MCDFSFLLELTAMIITTAAKSLLNCVRLMIAWAMGRGGSIPASLEEAPETGLRLQVHALTLPLSALYLLSAENHGEGHQQVQREPQGWYRVLDRERTDDGYR